MCTYILNHFEQSEVLYPFSKIIIQVCPLWFCKSKIVSLHLKADTENRSSFKGFIDDLLGEGSESVLTRDAWEAEAGRLRGAEWKLRRSNSGSTVAVACGRRDTSGSVTRGDLIIQVWRLWAQRITRNMRKQQQWRLTHILGLMRVITMVASKLTRSGWEAREENLMLVVTAAGESKWRVSTGWKASPRRSHTTTHPRKQRRQQGRTWSCSRLHNPFYVSMQTVESAFSFQSCWYLLYIKQSFQRKRALLHCLLSFHLCLLSSRVPVIPLSASSRHTRHPSVCDAQSLWSTCFTWIGTLTQFRPQKNDTVRFRANLVSHRPRPLDPGLHPCWTVLCRIWRVVQLLRSRINTDVSTSEGTLKSAPPHQTLKGGGVAKRWSFTSREWESSSSSSGRTLLIYESAQLKMFLLTTGLGSLVHNVYKDVSGEWGSAVVAPSRSSTGLLTSAGLAVFRWSSCTFP